MKDIILLVVPAIIALSLVFASIYILVLHPDQKIPEFMINSLTTIIGYYFGVGASKA